MKINFDMKKKYIINTEVICDFNYYGIDLVTSQHGSYVDTKMFKKMEIYKNPKKNSLNLDNTY